MSSNKSAHLGLHLWKPEDDFLRTEFNENSEMIDNAAAAARYVTLADVTTTAAAQQVDLDVSHIDFTALWEAELFCGITGDYGASQAFNLLANGLTSGYWRCDVNSSITYDHAVGWAFGMLGGARSFRLLIDNPNGRAIMDSTVGHMRTDITTPTFYAYHQLGLAPITWRELKTISAVNVSGSFPAGTRFFLRGVRR